MKVVKLFDIFLEFQNKYIMVFLKTTCYVRDEMMKIKIYSKLKNWLVLFVLRVLGWFCNES